ANTIIETVCKEIIEVSLEFTSSVLVDFETTNNIDEELAIESDKTTELLVEIESSDEQGLQLSAGDSFSSWDLTEVHLNNYAKAVGFSLYRN
ncbi:33459_t:CDS:2, partial [Racocetra persica]